MLKFQHLTLSRKTSENHQLLHFSHHVFNQTGKNNESNNKCNNTWCNNDGTNNGNTMGTTNAILATIKITTEATIKVITGATTNI